MQGPEDRAPDGSERPGPGPAAKLRSYYCTVPTTQHQTPPIDDHDAPHHRRKSVPDGLGDRAISPPRRRRTHRPHPDVLAGVSEKRTRERARSGAEQQRHRKNTHPRHQPKGVIVSNTPPDRKKLRPGDRAGYYQRRR